MKKLLPFVLFSAMLLAQPRARTNQIPVNGVGVPNNNTCNVAALYGNLYFDTTTAGDLYICGSSGWSKTTGSSVSLTGGTGISVSPNPITGTGVITNTAPGASPAGCPGAGSVELYLTATTFGCNANLNWDGAALNIYLGTSAPTSTAPFVFTIQPTVDIDADGGAVDPVLRYVTLNANGHTRAYIVGESNATDYYGDTGTVSSYIENTGSFLYLEDGTINGYAASIEADVENNGATVTGTMASVYANMWLQFGGSVSVLASEFYAATPHFGSTTYPSYVAFYTASVADGSHPNYDFWADEQGVYRIRADNTFNSVYQAIPALYNPQFTKYTPGLANYERIVEQWESNVAFITTENGGTGTLRNIQIDGAEVDLGTSSHLVNIEAATFKWNGKTCTLVGTTPSCS